MSVCHSNGNTLMVAEKNIINQKKSWKKIGRMGLCNTNVTWNIHARQTSYFTGEICQKCPFNEILYVIACSDSEVHRAIMGPTWVLLAPDGPHVGPRNLAIRVSFGPTGVELKVFQDNEVNIMAADTLARYVAIWSATMTLSMPNKQVLVFQGGNYSTTMVMIHF